MAARREQDALLAFINAFKLPKRVATFDQLSDGKTLMDVMGSIDPTYFKNAGARGMIPSAGPSSPSDNWVLKMNTLKRLYRLLLSYPLPSPHPSNLSLTSLPEPQFSSVAKNPKSPEGSSGLVQICRLCVAAGALGTSNEKVIPKIQALDEVFMAELMKTIEGVLATLPKAEEGEKEAAQVDVPAPSGLRADRDRLVQDNDELRARCEHLMEQVATMTANIEDLKQEREEQDQRLAMSRNEGAASSLSRSQTAASEVDSLRAELARNEEHLAETEAALEKQTDTVADLTKRVEDMRDQAIELSRLKDELDEYRHIAEKLQKSENVIEKYKKKLDDAAGLRRELKSLEEENATLVDRLAEIEGNLRKADSSKSLMESYKSQIDDLEKKVHDQESEIAELGAQLETTRDQLADVERDHERDRDELHIHQERVKELELGSTPGSKRPVSVLVPAGGAGSLNDELNMESEDGEAVGTESKSALKLRIRALQRELEEAKSAGPGGQQIATLETLLSEANKARDRYQVDYLEARKGALVAQTKLDQIRSGRGGDSAQTALALRQKLDEMTEENDDLLRDKQGLEMAKDDIEKQLAVANLDLSLVDKDKRSVLASLRENMEGDGRKKDEEVRDLKEQILALKDRDRLHLEEIRKLLVDKVDLQSAGISQRERAMEREMDISNLRASLKSKGVPEDAQQQIIGLHEANAKLVGDIQDLTDKLDKAKDFIKNQDALFRADHARPTVPDFGEAQKSYEAQIATLKAELQQEKQRTLGMEKRYRLEQQLMLSAWHELGSRTVRDHLHAAGTRRAQARPQSTSWLGRQRRHQEDALFTR